MKPLHKTILALLIAQAGLWAAPLPGPAWAKKILVNTQNGQTTVEVLNGNSSQAPTLPPPSAFPTLPVPPAAEIQAIPVVSRTPYRQPRITPIRAAQVKPRATARRYPSRRRRPLWQPSAPPAQALPELKPQFIERLPLPELKEAEWP